MADEGDLRRAQLQLHLVRTRRARDFSTLRSESPPASRAVLKVKATSSAVRGVPSENRASSRSVIRQVSRSSDSSQDVARSPIERQVGIALQKRRLKQRIAVPAPAHDRIEAGVRLSPDGEHQIALLRERRLDRGKR